MSIITRSRFGREVAALKKLEQSYYDGRHFSQGYRRTWMAEMEELMEKYETPPEFMERVAATQLDGGSLSWWSEHRKDLLVGNWKVFCEELYSYLEEEDNDYQYLQELVFWDFLPMETYANYAQRFREGIVAHRRPEFPDSQLAVCFSKWIQTEMIDAVGVVSAVQDINQFIDGVSHLMRYYGLEHIPIGHPF